ncbi:MAG: radical SAM protein [Polyangiaceae bacterium]
MSIRRLDVVSESFRPVYVVWELTLACDQRCVHCGSRADEARPIELNREQALEVVDQLAALGTREVVLIGGEAYLHPSFLEVISALSRSGVRPTLTTGGRGITADLAVAMKDAGLAGASVSIDGIGRTHDQIRATVGGFDAATRALDRMAQAGLTVFANTNFNRVNRNEVEAIYEHVKQHGASSWQVQITTPLGRAADRPNMILQPWDLLDLLPRLAAIKQRAFDEGFLVMPGNNLGYFGPEEALLRSLSRDQPDHWRGCQAGRFVMGIESDGAVKGCPSLQTAHYVGGNLRERSIQSIWESSPELAFTRERTTDSLWGFCATCPFASVCLGGCSFTAHAVLGRPGNNPYCHFRARTLAAKGQRERLVRVDAAPGQPFDNGRFEIVVEPFDTPEPELPPARRLQLVHAE